MDIGINRYQFRFHKSGFPIVYHEIITFDNRIEKAICKNQNCNQIYCVRTVITWKK